MARGDSSRFHVLAEDRLIHADLQVPQDDAVLATYAFDGQAEHVTMGEHGLHLTTSNRYLLQFKEPAEGMSEPSSRVSMGCHPLDAVERNGRLFLACGEAGVLIFDTAAAVGPEFVHSLEVEGEALQLSVTDEMLFVVTDDQFLLFELPDGSAPSLIAAYPGALYYTMTVASGNLMATNHWPGAGGPGWTILDVSDPLSPQVLTDTNPSWGMGRY